MGKQFTSGTVPSQPWNKTMSKHDENKIHQEAGRANQVDRVERAATERGGRRYFATIESITAVLMFRQIPTFPAQNLNRKPVCAANCD